MMNLKSKIRGKSDHRVWQDGFDIDVPLFNNPAFKQKTVFLAAFKAVDARFTFTTRAVFTDFKPLHSRIHFPF
jgi:hypothetical protein